MQNYSSDRGVSLWCRERYNPDSGIWSKWIKILTEENIGNYDAETGTNNGWTYRKWKNGKAECWKTINHDITSWAAWGNLFEALPKIEQQSYPQNLFKQAPNLNITISNPSIGISGWELYKENTSILTPEIFILRPNSVAMGTFKV